MFNIPFSQRIIRLFLQENKREEDAELFWERDDVSPPDEEKLPPGKVLNADSEETIELESGQKSQSSKFEDALKRVRSIFHLHMYVDR